MRGRHTHAVLRRLGINETIARDIEQYVDIAVALGRDRRGRLDLGARVAAGRRQLYGDLEPVRALEDFLIGELG